MIFSNPTLDEEEGGFLPAFSSFHLNKKSITGLVYFLKKII